MLALAHVVAAALAITGAKIETGDGKVIEHGTVVVDHGKIVAVGADVAVPAGAERVDGSGKVITPGLVAADATTGLVEVDMERASNDTAMSGPAVPAFRAIDGFNPSSPRVAIDRAEGVTREVLTPGGSLLRGQGFVVDLSGAFDSPARARRAAMFAGFGAAAKDVAGGARGGVLLRLREILDDVRFYEKNKAAYDRAQARELSLPRVHLEALVDVVDGKLPLVFAVNRASDILEVLAFAKEQKLKVIVSGGAEAWRVAPALAAAHVPVVLAPMEMMPYGFDALAARDDAPAILAKAGVTVVLTSGAGLGTTRLRQEAGVAVANGLDHESALRAVTESPARVFGVDDTGTIAAGQRGDLVLWSGDPFETTTDAELVLIDGARMSLDTRQSELVKKYRTLPVR